MNYNIGRTLITLWDGVGSSVWSAPRKTRYYQEIYEPIYEAGSEIEKNIQDLKDYSKSCVDQCDIV